MMHLRVISPADRTDEVLATLRDRGFVANLIVHRGAAVEPQGDVVIGDVPRESANEVVDALKELGIHRTGSIALDAVGVTVSQDAERVEEQNPGEGSEALVWEEISQRTGEEARLSVTFVLFLVLATIIAGIGVLLDQPILIVGAMVVGPEFGPLAALSVGIVRRHPLVIGRSLAALGVGFLAAIAITVVTTWGLDALDLVDRQLLLDPRPLTDFIWRPDALSWIVGFLAGIAGMLSLTTAKSGALIGVLISVTTVPAAGNVAVAMAYGVWNEAIGSLVQLGINLAAILSAGVLTLLVQGALQRREERQGR